MFREKGYAPLGNLIHPFHVAALRRYYRYLIRTGAIQLGDGQSPRRYVAYNEPVARFFHRQIAATLERGGRRAAQAIVRLSGLVPERSGTEETHRSGAMRIQRDAVPGFFSRACACNSVADPSGYSDWHGYGLSGSGGRTGLPRNATAALSPTF